MHILENDQLKVMVSDSGAELSSVIDKNSGLDRLWNAEPSVWNRHAPILFPFVGKVNGGVYRVNGQEYPMKSQHGFARDMEFVCVEKSDSTVVHKLAATEETKRIYPYEFELLVTHKLDAENPRLLHVKWEVKNTGTEDMYFSIGAHPAFTVPVTTKEERAEYYLEFPGKEELTYVGVNPANGLAEVSKPHALKLDQGFVQVYDDIYDTLVFDYQNIEQVRIARPDKTPYVTMTCKEFPFLGIWMKETGNFICLEPWVGRTDDDGFCGDLTEKTGEQKLGAGAVFAIEHTIEFHE